MENEHSRELLNRVSSGDREALAQLVARMAPAIRGLVQRRAPRKALERESATDLAQSVCREVLQRIDRGAFEYQDEAAFRAWLAGAVELKLGERWRRAHAAQREGEPSPGAAGSVDAMGTGTSPSGALAREEERERVTALLHRLPEDDRWIVESVHLRGLAHAEVAAELGITASHSRTRLARALARLATWITEDPGSTGPEPA